MKKAIIIIGPAGVGKTSLCSSIHDHAQSRGFSTHIFNMDPASKEELAELDIRTKYDFNSIMQLLQLGPNGTLMEIMKRLQNDSWLKTYIGDYDDDVLIIDTPGQIEAYIHNDSFLENLVTSMHSLDYELCILFAMDVTFLFNQEKLIMGLIITLCSMLQAENVPMMTIVTKIDTVNADMAGISNTLNMDSLSHIIETTLDADVTNNTKSTLVDKLLNILKTNGAPPIIAYNRENPDSIDSLHSKLLEMLNIDEFSDHY